MSHGKHGNREALFDYFDERSEENSLTPKNNNRKHWTHGKAFDFWPLTNKTTERTEHTENNSVALGRENLQIYTNPTKKNIRFERFWTYLWDVFDKRSEENSLTP